MANLEHQGFFSTEDSAVPALSSYQDRSVDQGADQLVENDGDLLIEAPTGAGKTAILARLAKEVCARRNKGKVLILTHRRNLLRQMVGSPKADTLKERLGEIAFWNRESAGTIAEAGLGGINQDPSIVIAMVETAANLKDLSGYTDIFIDETHHASEESSSREEKGSYARIIDRCPDARLAGVTATSFRGDEGKLHPRLENAKRIVIGVEETQNEGRTVKAKTTISKAKLTNGMTPTALLQAEREGRLERSASAIMNESKGEDYYETSMQEWEQITGGDATIGFVDSVNEIKLVTGYFNDTFGPGTAGMIHGGQADRENDQAIDDYKAGKIKVLMSCKMIGEGFDVPRTNNVISFNSSLSRNEMNQIVGRCVRSSGDKDKGNFIDCGTSTARHGLIEEQHKLQTVRALALSGYKADAARALARSSAAKGDDWSVAPGEKMSIFYRRHKGDKFEAFRVEHNLMRNEHRRVTGGNDAGRGLQRIYGPDDAPLMDMKQISVMVGEHVQDEAGFIARAGGLRGNAYVARGRREMLSWKVQLDTFSPGKNLDGMKRLVSAQKREENVRKAVRGEKRSQIGLRAVFTTIERAKSPVGGLRESIHLSGVVLDEIAKLDNTPLGLRKEFSAIAYNVAASGVKKMNTEALMKYSVMLKATLGAAGLAGISPSAVKVTKNLGDAMHVSQNRVRDLAEKNKVSAR
jgi:superfamily II DNA or RNA helicase